jgi:uncharacterized membrane protein YphA (DoxX/SURF4 family)
MSDERRLNSGLLIMRMGIAATLLYHAVPRLLGGVRTWIAVGKEISFLPPDIPAQAIGLTILAVQALGSLGLLTGFLFRLCALAITILFTLFSLDYFFSGHKTLGLYIAALACIGLGLLLSGPGRIALSVRFETK